MTAFEVLFAIGLGVLAFVLERVFVVAYKRFSLKSTPKEIELAKQAPSLIPVVNHIGGEFTYWEPINGEGEVILAQYCPEEGVKYGLFNVPKDCFILRESELTDFEKRDLKRPSRINFHDPEIVKQCENNPELWEETITKASDIVTGESFRKKYQIANVGQVTGQIKTVASHPRTLIDGSTPLAEIFPPFLKGHGPSMRKPRNPYNEAPPEPLDIEGFDDETEDCPQGGSKARF